MLTRHPLAVWSSYVESFFDGDHDAAHQNNPLLERYVPAIARFLRESPVPLLHVRYETLVKEPEARDAPHLRLPRHRLRAGHGRLRQRGRGAREGRARASAIRSRSARRRGRRRSRSRSGPPRWRTIRRKLAQARQILDRLLDEDLETWGYPRAGIVAQLDAVTPSGATKSRPWNRYALERRLLVRLRKNIHHNAFGRLVQRIRFVCDVLLR